jgi:hypothetical protein
MAEGVLAVHAAPDANHEVPAAAVSILQLDCVVVVRK